MATATIPQKEDMADGGLYYYVTIESFNSIINSLLSHYSGQLVRNKTATEGYSEYCRAMVAELKKINDDPFHYRQHLNNGYLYLQIWSAFKENKSWEQWIMGLRLSLKDTHLPLGNMNRSKKV